jgi:putative transcriptional regulator
VKKKLFAELVESIRQMNEIARRERAPSREFHVEPLRLQERRSKRQSSRRRRVSKP